MSNYATGRLSDFEKGQIIALASQNLSYSQIQQQVNRPRSTIQNFLLRYRERGTEKNAPTPGRPKEIDDHTRRRLVRETKKDRRQPLRELRNDVAPKVSVRTVKRALAAENIKKWRAKKRALLTEAHVRKRLAWAREHKDWDKAKWEGVIFSDECSVEKSKDPRGIWVFRTPAEKYDKDCIQGVTKGPGVKLMVWACIWGRNKGPLIPIFEKRVDRWVYIGILEDGLVDAHQEVDDTIGDPVFQQDNARIHTAADTMAWFEEHNIQVMDWPPNSPDLNPIEHCWKRLKEKMHQRYPNIHKTPGGPDAVRRRLAEALSEVWAEDIEGDFLESLWESMPRRVAAVLAAKGWYTKY